MSSTNLLYLLAGTLLGIGITLFGVVLWVFLEMKFRKEIEQAYPEKQIKQVHQAKHRMTTTKSPSHTDPGIDSNSGIDYDASERTLPGTTQSPLIFSTTAYAF